MEQTTFKTKLSHFITSHCLNRKPTTIRFYSFTEKIILKHWPKLEIPVDQISAADVLTFAQSVAHYSASYWNSIVGALRFICPHHGKLVKRRPVRIREFVPPGQSQFQALLEECDKAERSKATLIVRFLALTGLRISEARAVKWENVLESQIYIPGAKSKNSRPRLIPFLPGMKELLDRLRAVAEGEFVLPQENARKAIASACKRAGIDRMTHHSFRHYFATKCIEAGVDVPTVSRWLGHQDGGALAAKTYFHLPDEHSRNMAARVKIAA